MRLVFLKKVNMQVLSKTLGISNAKAEIIPDLSKALVILPDKNVRNSTTEKKGLKQYWKAGKRPHFSR